MHFCPPTSSTISFRCEFFPAADSVPPVLCSLDILLEVKEVVGGHLEGYLCGKETFFSVATIERMAKHFKVGLFHFAPLCTMR